MKNWIAIIIMFGLLFAGAILISSCTTEKKEEPSVLMVVGRPNEHTVILWVKGTQRQYVFRVENAYDNCYEIGQEIEVEPYLNKDYPE